MGERPSEEILVAPEYAILEFGDGYIALIQGGIEKEDEKGRQIVDFMIKPSELLKKRYNIKDSVLNVNGAMPFRILRKDLIPLNQFDDANKKWLYVKTFDHHETEISKLSWNLRKRLEELERRIITLEGELIWLSEQLQLAKTSPAEYMAQGTEIFEKVSSKLFDIFKPGKKSDEM